METSEELTIMTPTVETYKSKIIIGNFTIMLTKKFNWFNRLMLKLIFGLKVKNIKGEEEYEELQRFIKSTTL